MWYVSHGITKKKFCNKINSPFCLGGVSVLDREDFEEQPEISPSVHSIRGLESTEGMLGCQTNRVSQTKVQECKYSEFSNIGTAFHVYRTNSWYIGAVFSLPRWIPGNILSFLQEKKNVKLTLFADDITCSIKNSKFLRKSIFGTVRAVGECWWLEHRLFQSLRILIVKEADSIFYIFIWNGKDKVKRNAIK